MARGVKYLKDYLKKYESSDVIEKKQKKRKKTQQSKPEAKGVLVVDEDPVWQKQIDPEEEDNEDDSAEERLVVDEDIEVKKRMRRLEEIKAKHGNGWVTLSSNPEDTKFDISPRRRQRMRSDSPSPELGPRSLVFDRVETDMSPTRRRKRHYTPSPPEPNTEEHAKSVNSDFSPPHKRKARNDSPSPEPKDKVSKNLSEDLSPPLRRHVHPPSPVSSRKRSDSVELDGDLSPPRRNQDIHGSPVLDVKRESNKRESPPPQTSKEQQKNGLISGKDIGQNAEAVFRDKFLGKRISKEEYLKSMEKPKEIKLEWGKGLAQKREAEARLQEIELEKEKPFARTRDDPELDQMMKERVRWGDPMAHLVNKKQQETTLVDLGNDEKMKASGFVIPQSVPKHSWLTRGLEAASNRYGIKPGRHWDGVDRSTGNEKQMFKKSNEKRATETEAYLWSVSDM